MYSTREEYRFDDWGLMTLSYEGESEDGKTWAEGSIGEVEYDQEGKPLTYTIGEFYTEGSMDEKTVSYVVRAEYSDYVDVTASVRDLNVSGTAEEYYDLNGIRINDPAAGKIVVSKSGKKIKY